MRQEIGEIEDVEEGESSEEESEGDEDAENRGRSKRNIGKETRWKPKKKRVLKTKHKLQEALER